MLKIQPSQIITKITSLCISRRQISNDANSKSNGICMQNLWAVKFQVNQVKLKIQRGKKATCHVFTVTRVTTIHVTWPHPKEPHGLIV